MMLIKICYRFCIVGFLIILIIFCQPNAEKTVIGSVDALLISNKIFLQ